jgi:hypothetical protein
MERGFVEAHGSEMVIRLPFRSSMELGIEKAPALTIVFEPRLTAEPPGQFQPLVGSPTV